jgi:SAM-dependent methyltransferase
LDVGGRIQPYRGLFEVKGASYLAIDRILGGLVDVIAEAEHIPFADEIFDFVLCTQVLSYVTEPAVAVAEMYRVLKNGGFLFLSAPAFFPTHHDERWRFTQSGLQTLLSRFSDVQIMPEGHSFAGLCRTVNVSLNISLHNPLVRRVLRRIIIPLVNFLGSKLDRFSANNDQLITNISCFAQKKDSSIETNLVENDFDESFSKS